MNTIFNLILQLNHQFPEETSKKHNGKIPPFPRKHVKFASVFPSAIGHPLLCNLHYNSIHTVFLLVKR